MNPFRRLILPGHHVAALLADAGQDFGGDPLLELLGFRLPAGITTANHRSNLNHLFFIIIQITKCIIGSGNAQNLAHILGDEPRIAVVVGHGAEFIKHCFI